MKTLLSKTVALAACAMVILLASCESTSSTESDPKAPSDSVPVALPPNMIAWAGQNYRTVVIGKQTWMADNLNYKGTGTDTVGVCYNNSADSCKKYGRLYTWMAVMKLADSCKVNCESQIKAKHQGICPSGWHVPTEDEWTTLEDNVGDSIIGRQLKSSSGWKPSKSNTDAYGFTVLPGGYANSAKQFNKAGEAGGFWTASPQDNTFTNFRIFEYDYDKVVSFYNNVTRTFAFSLRCLKD